jgi:hypothetical protein
MQASLETIVETIPLFDLINNVHSTDPTFIHCPRDARDLFENGPSSSSIRTFSSSAKCSSVPVQLRWSS